MIKFKICLILLLINFFAFASKEKINSFAENLNIGLNSIGVTTSIEKIQASIGTAFLPSIPQNVDCISKSIKLHEDISLTNFLIGFGFKYNEFNVGEKVWKSAIARQFLKTTIADALSQTNIVLMRGGWGEKINESNWGVVEKINSEGLFLGKNSYGKIIQKRFPDKIIVFYVKNESISPNLLNDIILKSAINRLNNSILFDKEKTQGVISGCNLVDLIANRLHRYPFCPICKNNSYNCLYNIINTFIYDLDAGSEYLNNLSERSPDYIKKDIKEAANELSVSRDLLFQYSDKEKLKKIMRGRISQAIMAEKIRQINKHLTKATKKLALACNQETIDSDLQDDLNIYLSHFKEKKLARTLPLFSRINGLSNTFFVSATMAAGILGIERPVEWLQGVSGYSVRFLINTNSFKYVSDITEGYDCMERYLQAAGLVPIFNTFIINMPISAENMVRKDIIDSVNHFAPVIILAPGTTNKWGIIVGYEDYGTRFLCRLPYDTNYFFTKIREIPDITISLRKLKKIPTKQSQVYLALNQIMLLTSNTNFDEFASGRAAINLWIKKCNLYLKTNLTPSIRFAKENKILWGELTNKLRSYYKFLDLAIIAAPEIAPPLTVARNTLVQAVEQLNYAYADKKVLEVKKGIIFPKKHYSETLKKQIEVLEKVLKLLDDVNMNVEIAINQLKSK